MRNVAQFMSYAIVLIATACCEKTYHHSARELSNTSFGTCLSQLGDAKNAIESVKQFFQQVENILPGSIDIMALGKTRAEIDKLKAEMIEMQSFKREKENMEDQQISRKGGAIYIRWGRTTCGGNNTEVVYKGQVGGGHYTHSGASVNNVCLPETPDSAQQLGSGNFDFLYGGEYEIVANNKPYGMQSGLNDHDIPCVVCRAMKKSSSLMIPGRRRCFKEWSKEYDGYLMSGYYGHAKASEYACLDRNAKTIEGGSANQAGNMFYPVKTVCGSLKCPTYVGGTDVPCVVCTI